MATAPAAARSFFPLDAELELLPGSLTPSLVASLVRLGAEIPSFERAYATWHDLTQVRLSETTLPPPPPGPDVLQVSVAGAMVPVRRGQWAEVKTLAVGVVGTTERDGARVAQTTDVSSAARLADHETFREQVWPELHRRGLETAGQVLWIADGSEWCQGVADYHRPEGVRLLDFPHAVAHLATAAAATFGAQTLLATDWLVQQRQRLKYGEPADVLAAVLTVPVTTAADPAAATAAQAATFEYLVKRWDQIQYATFRALGYPIGSGLVESANKLVVEARLKGAGMHWARPHVNPLVALRAMLCSGRWAQVWPQIATRLRQRADDQARARRNGRQARCRATATVTAPPPVPSADLPATPGPRPAAPAPSATGRSARKPAPTHPWRRPFRSPRQLVAS